ncbi:hypothetical protein QA648_00465 [Rhizobium sp. CB3171]|uniref:hypothetical protein n=1 Tax=Rhizobium sp. CB3171 TaxID=3039157 RepID=UPI0024B0F592|nr:hypothetical protein [Rhizobium sp. CB3171]WFU02292.1 hypothetical protein QA648_00465 [Rhizobium sp. CB3171]
MKIFTTLNDIRAHKPLRDDFKRLLAYLGNDHADDEPLDVVTVLRCNGLDDVLWTLACEPQHWKAYRGLAIQFIWSEVDPVTDATAWDYLMALEDILAQSATDADFRAASLALGNAPSWTQMAAHQGVWSARWSVSNAVSEATLTGIAEAYLSSSAEAAGGPLVCATKAREAFARAA